MDQQGPMASQSIQDRCESDGSLLNMVAERFFLEDHGRNDPVARQILARNANEMGLAPPEDTSVVCQLYLLPARY